MPREPIERRLRRVWSDPRILLWSLGQLLLSPVLLIGRASRYARRRRPSLVNPDRWRMAYPAPDGAGPRVVIAAASFGELMLADRVAAALRQARPDAIVSYAFLDAKTAAIVRRERPGVGATLWPFDALPPILRWLRATQPDLVVFTERFRFPLWSVAAARFGARVALVNGRCRTRESLAYRLAAPVYRWQFGAFSAMAMQSEAYRRSAARFARPEAAIVATGDLKADGAAPSLAPVRAESLRAWLAGDLPLLGAGSTDDREEDAMVLDAFVLVRAGFACRLLLAPRRTTEVTETLAEIQKRGLSYALRSSVEPQTESADVLVLDGFGELATAYGACVAAYVGGSYGADGAGHNVMEPLVWGVPVAYGLRRGYFEALQLLCEARGLGTRIEGSKGLAAFWESFLAPTDERERLAESALALIAENRGAVTRTVEMLLPLLPDEA